MTIYTDKINEFISNLESEVMEINQDIRQLETKKQVYEKILTDLPRIKKYRLGDVE